MELANTNDENSFDPTPRLKSSPIPIKFISFNGYDNKCIYCGEEYIKTLFCYGQKYCKKCISSYINDITDNNTYLDVNYTMDLKKCSKYEISRTKVPQNIQECCKNCLTILCFKQISGDFYDYFSYLDYCNNYSFDRRTLYNNFIEKVKYCNLCGKSLYQGTDRDKFKLCSDCYLISYECIESTLVKKQITILYLPLWYNNSRCDSCNSKLKFKSDCQKYCVNCFIYYVGCRYCLTTNIIFGLTNQSQCKKCKRVSFILYNELDLETFLINNICDDIKLPEFADIIKNIDKYFTPWQILKFEKIIKKPIIEWIPYSQFTNVKEMTKGGYGIIYKAEWLSKNETVILKRFENSKNNSKYFLNELKSNHHFFTKYNDYIINIYGFTKDPELEDYILVMEYAVGGDLHKHLQNNFTNITWSNKINILSQISSRLNYVHNHKFIHRDFHSGNILNGSLTNYNIGNWRIGDLGLSYHVNNTSKNSEIYGVIPYIAPEIFKGSAFSKEADIYSFGMIMWELTTGCKPFANVNHDIHLIYKILDGGRPKITEDTPEFYANLMKSCWDPDPKKRPSVTKIYNGLVMLIDGYDINSKVINQVEAKRKELIQSKKIGPEFAEKCHPGAIYTSRPLSALISECSSAHSTTISFGNKEDYNHNYTSKEQDLDIDIESSSSQNLTIQNSSVSLKKRNIEKLNLDRDNSVGKRIKISSLIS